MLFRSYHEIKIMSILTLLEDMGDDLDLLVRSDEWLEEERRSMAAEMDRIARELRSIYTAQRLKRELQQSNLVAVQSLITGDDGEIKDINIAIMPVNKAKNHLDSETGNLAMINREAQIGCWRSDGYDVD